MRWLENGELKNFETVYDGVAQCGQAFADMFAGGNRGKTIVRV